MRVVSIVVLLASLLAVTSCASTGQESPETSVSVAVQSADPGARAAVAQVREEVVALGVSEDTVGSRFSGGGELEIAPLSVVYLRSGGGVKSRNGVFAVAIVQERNTGAVPTQQAAPVEGGGWRWVPSEGKGIEEIEEQNGAALEMRLGDFEGGAEIQPGASARIAVVFDLEKKQRGGTLLYVDGKNTPYRWKVPAEDTGPYVMDLKERLRGS